MDAPTYDLTLMLDPAAPDDVRAKIVADARKAIEAHGELVGHHEWGVRRLAFEIRHKPDAEYHLLQFRTDEKPMLETLTRQLRITDGVIRHRVVKLAPGTPAPPDLRAPVPAAAPPPPPPPAPEIEPEVPEAPASDVE